MAGEIESKTKDKLSWIGAAAVVSILSGGGTSWLVDRNDDAMSKAEVRELVREQISSSRPDPFKGSDAEKLEQRLREILNYAQQANDRTDTQQSFDLEDHETRLRVLEQQFVGGR